MTIKHYVNEHGNPVIAERREKCHLLSKLPVVPTRRRSRLRLFYNQPRFLVVSESRELRMPQMIDLRLILHLFMAGATISRDQRLLRVERAQQ